MAKRLSLKDKQEIIKHYSFIIIGSVFGALAYPLYLVPNSIAPGGVTGVGMVLNHVAGWPVGLTSLLLNIPLFLFGYRAMGRRFVYRTLLTTILFSVLIDLFQVKPVTHDPLLATVFGGTMLGLGLGLIMRGGATTGGTDMLARVVHKRFSVISVGAFLLAIDGCVILLAGITMSAEHAMYSMICVVIFSVIIDKVLAGLGTDKACHIITTKPDRIAQRLLDELDRGVTILDGVGAYSRAAVQLLVCVVPRMQVMGVKDIVKEEDPVAFVFITDTHETLGEGFRALIEKEN